MLLKKVLNVSAIFGSSDTISLLSKSIIFELLDNFFPENNWHIVSQNNLLLVIEFMFNLSFASSVTVIMHSMHNNAQ